MLMYFVMGKVYGFVHIFMQLNKFSYKILALILPNVLEVEEPDEIFPD